MSGPDLDGLRVGFVGAGRIGSPMAERLAQHGAEVTVHARRSEVRAALEASGCRSVATLAELGSDNALFISCLYSDAQLESITDELVELLASGSVFASHTTGSPAVVRAFAERVRPRGVAVVDAPFSGTPEHIREGRLTVMLGGDAVTLDAVEPAMRSYAGTVFRTGDLGSALVLKLLNNAVFAANVQLGLEVGRLAERLGVSLPTTLDVLNASSGGTAAMGYMREFAGPAEYAEQVRPFLVKDVAICEEVATGLGLDLGLLARVMHGGVLDVSAP
jgi:3-hydroxyisobutyrate dehydrogenase-like beta-hydroxyacid dehydrogenase